MVNLKILEHLPFCRILLAEYRVLNNLKTEPPPKYGTQSPLGNFAVIVSPTLRLPKCRRQLRVRGSRLIRPSHLLIVTPPYLLTTFLIALRNFKRLTAHRVVLLKSSVYTLAIQPLGIGRPSPPKNRTLTRLYILTELRTALLKLKTVVPKLTPSPSLVKQTP